ncbi:MAG: hypothetical protein JST54_06920 [Deltaproteobacteria bacterium]|nr:hypothetical protein [Deltaproteobacteria bacterium]
MYVLVAWPRAAWPLSPPTRAPLVKPSAHHLGEQACVSRRRRFPPSDKEKVGAYILRTAMGSALGGEPAKEHVTVREAIDLQTAFEAEQAKKAAEARALKEKLQAENAAVQKQMDDALAVTITSVTIEQGSFSKAQYENHVQRIFGAQMMLFER